MFWELIPQNFSELMLSVEGHELGMFVLFSAAKPSPAGQSKGPENPPVRLTHEAMFLKCV